MFTLHNGDCLQVLPSIPSRSIDAIITDLPYGSTSCAWDVVIPFAEMWKEVNRVLKPNGVFVTTSNQPFTSALIMSNIENHRDEWIWDKVNGANFGNVKYSPFRTHESIQVFCEGIPRVYNPIFRKVSKPFGKISMINSEVTASKTKPTKQGVGYPETIIRIMRPNNLSDGGLHPTQKPVALYRYLISTYTNPSETVLDICMGSGTTIEAAIIEGRYSIGIEKEQGYYSIAEKRAKQAVLSPNFFTPSNNRLHLTGGGQSATQSSFTAEVIPPAKLPVKSPRR